MKTNFPLFLSSIFIFVSSSLWAQVPDNPKKLIGKLSLDYALLGSGDMHTVRMENALEYRVNPYFTPSVSLGIAKSDRGFYISSSMIQANANLFFSPFRNDKPNDFRIGVGFAGMRISDFLESAQYYENGQYSYSDYDFRQENTYGFNLILENNYQVSTHVLVGLRLNYQLFDSGDQLIGGGINLGFQI
ncbi:MAG: hypothetical protein AAF927_21105 [Bacteroidota bacterium]